MGTASQAQGDLVAALTFDDLPGDVVVAARRHLADAAGVAVSAAFLNVGTEIVDLVRSWAGAAESSVLGYEFAAPAPIAALVNGSLAHALDFDDTHVESVVHPSAVIMATVFAVGEEIEASGRDVLTAAVAGYEVATRVGAAAPGRFQRRGIDATGLCGAFGAAAAAGKLWGLTAEEIAHALGIAGSRGAGALVSVTEGGGAQALSPGWAAHSGVLSADLARRGVAGPTTIYEGPLGVFTAFLHGEEPDLGRLTRGLGATWETTRIGLKPYPASDFVHAFIDAGLRARVKWADIEEIECSVAPAVVPIIAEPRAPRLHPATTGAAQSSLPFAVATAIVGGRTALDMFGVEARHDRRILHLAERVHHVADPGLAFPRTFGGTMRIMTRSGRTLTYEEAVNRGHPDRPLTEGELHEKFMMNTAPRLGHPRARQAWDALLALDEAGSIAEVTSHLRTPAP